MEKPQIKFEARPDDVGGESIEKENKIPSGDLASLENLTEMDNGKAEWLIPKFLILYSLDGGDHTEIEGDRTAYITKEEGRTTLGGAILHFQGKEYKIENNDKSLGKGLEGSVVTIRVEGGRYFYTNIPDKNSLLNGRINYSIPKNRNSELKKIKKN